MRIIRIVTILLVAIILALSVNACGSQPLPFIKKAPTAPGGLSGQANSYSEIALRWVDNSDNEAGFKIYRNGILIESVVVNVTTFFDIGLQYGTTYTYSVSAYNDVGETRSTTNAQIKTFNPPIVITLDRIGVIKDHDPWPKGAGEIYMYLAISDGKSQPQIIRIPSSQTITLNDNESKDIQQQVCEFR